jgi:hypothetical protein
MLSNRYKRAARQYGLDTEKPKLDITQFAVPRSQNTAQPMLF